MRVVGTTSPAGEAGVAQTSKFCSDAWLDFDSRGLTSTTFMQTLYHRFRKPKPIQMASKADEFRKNAADCRQLAEITKNSFDKEHWLEVAQHWLKMAAAEEAATKTDPR